MKINLMSALFFASAASVVSAALVAGSDVSLAQEEHEHGKDTGALVAALPQSKVSIVDAIKQATKGAEVPISAKYELDDKGKLSLSVYTAEGLNQDAKLQEVSGSADATPWKPTTEEIKDKDDIKDAKEQVSVLSKAKVTLADVAQKAEQSNQGTVIAVIPQGNHNDIEVETAANGKANEHHYDLTSGKEVKMQEETGEADEERS